MAVNATAVWRFGPSGSDTNGGGYDAGISGAGTDYSQQNSAQASGTHGTAAGSAAFSDTIAANFTSAMVGNALYLTGTGLTTGFYFCVGYTDASHITLDRSPGTGTVGTWHLGGRWKNLGVNDTSSGPIVPGNLIYLLGSGAPNPASYTYDYAVGTGSYYSGPAGNQTTGGYVRYIGDPNTPSSGKPTVKGDLIWFGGNGLGFENIWFVAQSGSFNTYGMISSNGYVKGCVYDQFGYDNGLCQGGVDLVVIGTEISSSVAKRSTNAAYGLVTTSISGQSLFNNIHDCIGPGQKFAAGMCAFNVIAKNGANGLDVDDAASTYNGSVHHNTIDNNLGHGLNWVSQQAIALVPCFNNLITNHTGSGKYGMTAAAGTQAQNDHVKMMIDFNTYYGNTSNVNAISLGAHDTTGGANPYANEASDDFTLTSSYYGAGTYPGAVTPQYITGWNG